MDLLSYDIFNKEISVMEKKFDNSMLNLCSMDEISMYTEAGADSTSFLKKIKDMILNFIRKLRDTISRKTKELKHNLDMKKIHRLLSRTEGKTFIVEDYADADVIVKLYKMATERSTKVLKQIRRTIRGKKRDELLDNHLKFLDRVESDMMDQCKEAHIPIDKVTMNLIDDVDMDAIEKLTETGFSAIANDIMANKKDPSFSNAAKKISQKLATVGKRGAIIVSGNMGKIISKLSALNKKVIKISVTKGDSHKNVTLRQR